MTDEEVASKTVDIFEDIGQIIEFHTKDMKSRNFTPQNGVAALLYSLTSVCANFILSVSIEDEENRIYDAFCESVKDKIKDLLESDKQGECK